MLEEQADAPPPTRRHARRLLATAAATGARSAVLLVLPVSGAFLGIGAKLAGNALFSKAKGILTSIPPQVWQALAVLGYALALYLTHSRAVHEHDTAIIAANNAQWEKKLDAAVAAMKAKDAELAGMSAQLRKANDEENRAIAADAAAVRVSGPGKAACPRVASAAAAAGGHVAPVAKPDASGSALPADDFAAVPWGWLTDRAEEHDQLDAEALAWRTWYAKLVAAWPQSAAPKP